MNYASRIREARINQLHNMHLSAASSRSILTKECPCCEFYGECEHIIDDSSDGHIRQLCKARSWDLGQVWIETAPTRPSVHIGARFGKLLVLFGQKPDDHGNPRWMCKCDCGRSKIVRGANLLSGKTNSCGCEERKKSGSGTSPFKNVEKNSWRYTLGSSCNPDGTRHKFINGHEGKVGKSVCHVVETVDDRKNKHHFLELTKCDCGGQIRIDEHGDRVCDKCNWILG
jgi:hypothetical protein